MWVEEGIEHAGAKIALGHHGEHVHAGHELESAVTIERDGEPVADAEVFNSLLSADGEVLVDEVATIYEPTTAEEPAHYAQGSLAVPSGVDKVTVRYRICLGDGSEELTKDVTLDVD